MQDSKDNVDRRIQTYRKLKEMMGLYYLTSKNASENDRKLAWITSGAPVEFLQAMDVIPIYPEQHAAMCGAEKMAVELQEVAEGMGYSQDLCSYARTDIGQMATGKSPIMGLPRPDFVFACNNICGTVVKWFEVVARHYDVPIFVLDTPFLHSPIDDSILDYIKDQLMDLVAFLQVQTGRDFDWDRFKETLVNSAVAVDLWTDILDACANVPSPMTCFDAFIHMAPVVTLRGTTECIDYYTILKDEINERVRRGISAIPSEKYRLLWDNLPLWFNLRGLSNKLAEQEACLVAATYTSSWSLGFADFDDSIDVLAEVAKAYVKPYINSGFASRIATLKEMIAKYRVDGFLMHSDRSCKPYSLGQYQIRDIITRETGIPGLVIEGDQTDSRLYAEGPTATRIEAFVESLQIRH